MDREADDYPMFDALILGSVSKNSRRSPKDGSLQNYSCVAINDERIQTSISKRKGFPGASAFNSLRAQNTHGELPAGRSLAFAAPGFLHLVPT